MAAFIVPHQAFPDKNPPDFQTTVDVVEARMGVDFFLGLPGADRMDAAAADRWGSAEKNRK